MKNKIFAFLILVVLIFTSGCVSAFANEADTGYENARALVEGINPSFALPDDPTAIVTRGELVESMVGLYNMNLPNMSAKFTDVSGSMSKSIAFAQNLGLVDSGLRFYPDNAADYQTAMKMGVIMLGYTPWALSSGYSMTAESIGLSDGLTGTEMTVRNVTVLLANILETDIMVQRIFGDSNEYVVNKDMTFLTHYHDVYRIEDVVWANSHSSLTSSDSELSDGEIQIGTSVFKSDKQDFLGYRVAAYYRQSSEEIVAIFKYDNNELTFDGIKSISGNRLEYEDSEGNADDCRIDEAYIFLYNGDAYTKSDYQKHFYPENGSVTLIDNNGDNRYDVVSVTDYTFMLVKSVDTYNKKIYDFYGEAYLDMSDTDAVYEVYSQLKFDTVEASLDAVAAGSVITYTKSDDGKYYRIYVSEVSVEGKFDGINKGDKTLTVDGVTYKYNSYFEKHYLAMMGEAGSFSLGYDGSVTVMDASLSPYEYAWVIDAGYKSSGLNTTFDLLLYTQEGIIETFSSAESVRVDGEKMTYEKAFGVINKNKTEGSDYDNLIKYKLNSDGKVALIDTVYTPSSASELYEIYSNDNSLNKYYEGKYRFRLSPKTFADKFRMNASTVIFMIPTNPELRYDEDNYSILEYTASYFTDFITPTMAAYDLDTTGLAGALIIMDAGASGVSLSDGVTGIVYGIRNVYFPDDGETKKVYDVYISGAYRSLTARNTEVEELLKGVEPGDMVRIACNVKDEIINAIHDYDYSAGDFMRTFSGDVDYFKGYVADYNGSQMTVVTDMTAASMADVSFDELSIVNASASSTFNIIITKDKNGNITDVDMQTIDPTTLKTFINNGSGADRAVVRRRLDATQLTAVYTEYVR